MKLMEIFSFFPGYDVGLPVISGLLSTNDTNGFSVNESLDNRLSVWKPGLMWLFLRLYIYCSDSLVVVMNYLYLSGYLFICRYEYLNLPIMNIQMVPDELKFLPS